MVESCDLAMVTKKLKQNDVPLDVVFLAIAESCWIPNASS